MKELVTISIDSKKRCYVLTSRSGGHTCLYWDSYVYGDGYVSHGVGSHMEVEAILEAENIPYKWAPYHA